MRKWLPLGIPVILIFVALGIYRSPSVENKKNRRQVAESHPHPRRVSDPPQIPTASNRPNKIEKQIKEFRIKRLDANYGNSILKEALELDRTTQIQAGKLRKVRRDEAGARAEFFETRNGKGTVKKVYQDDLLTGEAIQEGKLQFGRNLDIRSGRTRHLWYSKANGDTHDITYDFEGRVSQAIHSAQRCIYIQNFKYGELLEEIQDCKE